MEIQINNDMLDDKYIMIDLLDFQEDELKELVKVFSLVIINTNIEALGKIKEYANNCGLDIK